MAILKGDVKLVASQTMDDVPEGGGAPTANIIQDGESNNIFPDISELDRAGGRVNLRKVHVHVQTGDRDTLLGTNFIVAEPPNDPNVSITVFSTRETFDRRADAADTIERYLVKGPALSGYLLENHVIGQRSIQLLQRPGSLLPTIGRTLVLVVDEDTPDEIVQYVRTTRVEVEKRMFSEVIGSALVDFEAEVVTCDISDALRSNFPGSPPTRLFAAQAGKTRVRDTTVADAGSYHGVVALTEEGEIGDATVQVSSVYTQLVPSARTEVSTLDQKPAAERNILLAETPKLVEVGASPHTMRIKIGQENRGFNFVQILRPFPAPNTLTVSYRALGSWYSLTDDGTGNLVGAGSGTVVYATGSIAVTTTAMPDVGSAIIFSWGDTAGYTNRSASSATIRPPEFSWLLPDERAIPGTVEFTWSSGGVTKTATADVNGDITGDATGKVDHPSGTVIIRPTAMPDPGAEIVTDYDVDTEVIENITPGTPDAGGFITFTLADEPAAGTLTVLWATVRNVSNTSGAAQTFINTVKKADVEYTTRAVPETYDPGEPVGAAGGGGGGGGGGPTITYPAAPATPRPNWPGSD